MSTGDLIGWIASMLIGGVLIARGLTPWELWQRWQTKRWRKRMDERYGKDRHDRPPTRYVR